MIAFSPVFRCFHPFQQEMNIKNQDWVEKKVFFIFYSIKRLFAICNLLVLVYVAQKQKKIPLFSCFSLSFVYQGKRISRAGCNVETRRWNWNYYERFSRHKDPWWVEQNFYFRVDRKKFSKLLQAKNETFYSYLKNSTVASFRGEVLKLTKIARNEMGSYLCIASNSVPPSVSKRISLNIHCKFIIRLKFFTTLHETQNYFRWNLS